MSSSRRVIGIDLGTTYSLVAAFGPDGPRVLPNALGQTLTPSAVSVTSDDTVLVGEPARARLTTHPEATALSFKRDMGTERQFRLGKKTLSPVDLSAAVLATLKRDAEAALGHAVDEAIITVPAYFNEPQRRATRDAGTIAGLRVDRIVNEPTAAALAYGLHQRDRNARIAVLDLGGGTFDVTVLEIAEGVIEIQSSAGDTHLGGDDFTGVLVDLVARRNGLTDASEKNATVRARLTAAIETAKRALSHDEEAELHVPALSSFPRKSLTDKLTRKEAEEAFLPLVERMRLPVLRALRDARVRTEQIDEVLLVGGATRMPCVERLAQALFGRPPLRRLPPDEAVALGAAVQGALQAADAAVEDMVVTDVAPFSMGIATASTHHNQVVGGLYTPILERGTVLPASRVSRFATMRDNQTSIDVEIFQGEHPLCRDNQELGVLKVSGIPSNVAGGESIDVRFSYDTNGLLEVDVHVVSTGRSTSLVIERSKGALTAAQIEEARQRLARLKFHPREALPNLTALAKGDALYLELTGVPRSILGELLADFRAALESQDATLIDERRNRLNAFFARS